MNVIEIYEKYGSSADRSRLSKWVQRLLESHERDLAYKSKKDILTALYDAAVTQRRFTDADKHSDELQRYILSGRNHFDAQRWIERLAKTLKVAFQLLLDAKPDHPSLGSLLHEERRLRPMYRKYSSSGVFRGYDRPLAEPFEDSVLYTLHASDVAVVDNRSRNEHVDFYVADGIPLDVKVQTQGQFMFETVSSTLSDGTKRQGWGLTMPAGSVILLLTPDPTTRMRAYWIPLDPLRQDNLYSRLGQHRRNADRGSGTGEFYVFDPDDLVRRGLARDLTPCFFYPDVRSPPTLSFSGTSAGPVFPTCVGV